MKIKTLLSLMVVALVLVGLAKWSSNRGKPAPGAARIGDKVLPGFVDRINDVSSIRVVSPVGTASVARVDGVWRVPGRYGYRADFTKVTDALRKLIDLKIAQVMRVTPAQVADLHLLAPGAGSNAEQRATLVELKTSDGATLAALRLGKPHSRPSPAGAPPDMGGYPDGRYVALEDGKVYLVADQLDDLATADREWLDQDFLNVPATDLASIEVTGGTNGPIRIAHPAAGGDLTLQDVPAGKEADGGKVSRLTGALGYLHFEDVADPALAPSVTGLDKPTVVKATTLKGTVYTLKIGASPTNDTRRYVNVAVSFAAPAVTGAVATAASGTDTNAVAAAKAKADESLKAEAAAKTLNDKFSPWVFLLGDYQAGSLLLPVSEMVKDKTPPPVATTNAVPSAAASTEPVK